jgi:hypothetical protein
LNYVFNIVQFWHSWTGKKSLKPLACLEAGRPNFRDFFHFKHSKQNLLQTQNGKGHASSSTNQPATKSLPAA